MDEIEKNQNINVKKLCKKVSKKKKVENNILNEEKSENNFSDEFIPKIHHWLSIEEQKEKTEEIENITKN